MFELLVGLVLFAVTATIANILQSVFKYTYTDNPLLFVFLFIFPTAFVAWLMDYKVVPVMLVLLVITALVYVLSIKCLVRFWKPMKYLYKADRVPLPYQGIVVPKVPGQVVKVNEVVLQDISAWLIVGGLLSMTSSIWVTVLIFTIVVFILHIPGLWLYSRVYGLYFLVLSSTLAFIVPILHNLDLLGFVLLYIIHLSGYILMYLLMGYLGLSASKRYT